MAKNIVSNTISFGNVGFFPSFIILAKTYKNAYNFYWLMLFNLNHLVGINNLYRIRIRDYRIVYTIEDKKLLILVVKIGHRKDIYKR